MGEKDELEGVNVLRRTVMIKYTTETKRDNVIAQSMYRSLGFEITNEVVTTLKH